MSICALHRAKDWTDDGTKGVGMQQVYLDEVIEVRQLARFTRGLFECQTRIRVFPIFIVALDWELDVMASYQPGSADQIPTP